ncbi:alkylated DNA repair protein-like protein alkB 6 [Bombardia bombarda]|uniref:Alkylated DNA repair protein-like protein alkB 6 n=1 Tax=Bombardia bombarda TaxID=252184 RepID=A0AA40C1T6_9PEZI|nr:alkylated DNA repair protein-like protein alkB 6 [Bombardia bombarda]
MDPVAADDSPLSKVHLPASLEQCRITALPPSAYYIPDFISEEEEKLILDKIENAPKARWRQLTHRRLQTWPSDLVQNTLLSAQSLPEWLEKPVVARLLSIPDGGAYHPVVCTVSLGSSICLNLYKSKEDGALDPEPVWRILQEPRSLLITTAELYSEYLHGIEPISEDTDITEQGIANWNLLRSPSLYKEGRHPRQTRVSLTYRDVLKVSKLGNKLGPLFKRT